MLWVEKESKARKDHLVHPVPKVRPVFLVDDPINWVLQVLLEGQVRKVPKAIPDIRDHKDLGVSLANTAYPALIVQQIAVYKKYVYQLLCLSTVVNKAVMAVDSRRMAAEAHHRLMDANFHSFRNREIYLFDFMIILHIF